MPSAYRWIVSRSNICVSVVACKSLLVPVFTAFRGTRCARVPAWYVPAAAVAHVPIVVSFIIIEAILLPSGLSLEWWRDQGWYGSSSLVELGRLRLEPCAVPATAPASTATTVPASTSADCPPPSASCAVVLGCLLWWWWRWHECSWRWRRCICGIVRRL